MPHIVVPRHHRADGNVFADLLNDPSDQDRVMRRFVQILAASFQEDRRRSGEEFVKRIHTQAEERRRADILGRWYRTLRKNGYGQIQTMDELPRALRAKLDGVDFELPEKNRLWAP